MHTLGQKARAMFQLKLELPLAAIYAISDIIRY